MNTLLESALSYASMGWFIFPARELPGKPYINSKGKLVTPKEKSPYIKDGFKSSSIDIYQIKEWWTKWPNAAIGVSCGNSNLFVIDIDVKHGHSGIDNYMQLGISDLGALHSRTPSGGLHKVFSGLGKTTTNVLDGIDTRSIGGYFIAPPSRIIRGEHPGNYVALNDWNRVPDLIPDLILEKMNVKKKEKRNRYFNHFPELSLDENINKAREALEKLPTRMVNNYQSWIEVGMSLFSLGDSGLILWEEWSKKSEKYSPGECEIKWSTFKPEEISLGSLFYYSKEAT